MQPVTKIKPKKKHAFMATKTLAMQSKKISFELHFLIFGIIPRKNMVL